ncbi:MAG: hypothetical protein AAF611_09665 [Bacteroidota bacterium]
MKNIIITSVPNKNLKRFYINPVDFKQNDFLESLISIKGVQDVCSIASELFIVIDDTICWENIETHICKIISNDEPYQIISKSLSKQDIKNWEDSYLLYLESFDELLKEFETDLEI